MTAAQEPEQVAAEASHINQTRWWAEAVAAEAAVPMAASVHPALPVPTTLPDYAASIAVPSITVSGTDLGPDEMLSVIWSALHGVNDPRLQPRPLVEAVRGRMESPMRDRLGLALFEAWLRAGAPPKQRALFVAAGFLGADGFVDQVMPYVLEWPGHSAHQRSVVGLKAVAATGTFAAWQALTHVAKKAPFPGLRAAAGELMNTLTAHDPDPASATPELSRRQLNDLVRIQSAYLAEALSARRTWPMTEHRQRWVDHPHLNSLVRPLVWEIIDGDRRTLVRVTDEREYLTVDDAVVTPSADAHIRVAHPLDLSEAERSRWQQHLTDFDLISPIEQLDAPVPRRSQMRAFGLTDGTSDKFWNIDVVGDTITVHFGRNGTKGQTKTTRFATAAAASSAAHELIESKIEKGYQEYDAHPNEDSGLG